MHAWLLSSARSAKTETGVGSRDKAGAKRKGKFPRLTGYQVARTHTHQSLRVARLFGRYPHFRLVGSVDEGKIHYATITSVRFLWEINTVLHPAHTSDPGWCGRYEGFLSGLIDLSCCKLDLEFHLLQIETNRT
ncbi:hypothetical protein AVEN_65437-1 [Araneus ventricosus]|uniref:Uncharacterized protein n=1 Tax=Araneus ventricosus TaxID=182803 RepID=A0A4Y2WBQ5_ARAVE|nr:hypothetical protein AVEN_65437-1 [Araneus ventricosus]